MSACASTTSTMKTINEIFFCPHEDRKEEESYVDHVSLDPNHNLGSVAVFNFNTLWHVVREYNKNQNLSDQKDRVEITNTVCLMATNTIKSMEQQPQNPGLQKILGQTRKDDVAKEFWAKTPLKVGYTAVLKNTSHLTEEKVRSLILRESHPDGREAFFTMQLTLKPQVDDDKNFGVLFRDLPYEELTRREHVLDIARIRDAKGKEEAERVDAALRENHRAFEALKKSKDFEALEKLME